MPSCPSPADPQLGDHLGGIVFGFLKGHAGHPLQKLFAPGHGLRTGAQEEAATSSTLSSSFSGGTTSFTRPISRARWHQSFAGQKKYLAWLSPIRRIDIGRNGGRDEAYLDLAQPEFRLFRGDDDIAGAKKPVPPPMTAPLIRAIVGLGRV